MTCAEATEHLLGATDLEMTERNGRLELKFTPLLDENDPVPENGK